MFFYPLGQELVRLPLKRGCRSRTRRLPESMMVRSASLELLSFLHHLTMLIVFWTHGRHWANIQLGATLGSQPLWCSHSSCRAINKEHNK